MKILQLCFRVPYPPHDGGAIAMFNITKGLSAAGHEVTVLAFNTPKHFQNDTALKGIATLRTVFVDTSVSASKAFLNLFKSIPYNVERFISAEFTQALNELLTRETFDVVHLEGLYVAVYVDQIRALFKGPVLLRTHNVEYLIWQRLARNERNPLKKVYLKMLSSRLKKYEQLYFPKFDRVAAISSEDARLIKTLSEKAKVVVVPAGVEIPEEVKASASLPTVFMISAMEWKPNVEGFWWFMEKVWPGLTQQAPELEFHVAGKRTPPSILDLKVKNVHVAGFVEDAGAFMATHGLMLVPLLSGSGTRIKILEGMAAGKCILTTTVGAEGTECIPGENILIADSPEEWITRITDFYRNPGKYRKIGENAREWAKEKYSNGKITEKLVALYKELL